MADENESGEAATGGTPPAGADRGHQSEPRVGAGPGPDQRMHKSLLLRPHIGPLKAPVEEPEKPED